MSRKSRRKSRRKTKRKPKNWKIKRVFDADYAKKMAKDWDLKVTLKKNFKGVSLFARKPIKKGNVIAYYKFLVHKYTDGFNGKLNGAYVMSIYRKDDRFNHHVIGDIYEGSLRPPKYNIPFWAYFSNEPSGNQPENCYLDINLAQNYRNRSKVKPGDTMIYKLVASKNIKPGQEICWCYGGNYGRDYPANCDD
jgi:hypothetical protein